MGRAGAEIVSVNAATIGDDVADGSDEIVMYILVRGDLGMSKGKIAAQAGHAVQRAIRAVENLSIERPMSGFASGRLVATPRSHCDWMDMIGSRGCTQLRVTRGLFSPS